jgi:small subunit ribosomal protein S17e
MGRIKSTAVKTLARDILSEHADKFTANFDKNKNAIQKLKEIKSKKIRNVVAGYITKEKKREKSAK